MLFLILFSLSPFCFSIKRSILIKINSMIEHFLEQVFSARFPFISTRIPTLNWCFFSSPLECIETALPHIILSLHYHETLVNHWHYFLVAKYLWMQQQCEERITRMFNAKTISFFCHFLFSLSARKQDVAVPLVFTISK